MSRKHEMSPEREREAAQLAKLRAPKVCPRGKNPCGSCWGRGWVHVWQVACGSCGGSGVAR